MRAAATTSWQIREGLDQHLAMALYVREAAGLSRHVRAEPDVGALEPAVPAPGRAGAGADPHPAADEWRTWWARALQQVPPAAPPATWQEAERTAPPAPPHWHGVHDLPAVRALAEEHHRAFWSWLNALEPDERARQPGRPGRPGGGDPLHLTRLVTSCERRLGRRARPFTLHLRLLPLQRPAGWVLDDRQVLLSTGLRADPAAVERLLEPVVAALV